MDEKFLWYRMSLKVTCGFSAFVASDRDKTRGTKTPRSPARSRRHWAQSQYVSAVDTETTSHHNQKSDDFPYILVGAAGFEPATPASRT
jgi:hypothetical protein